MTAESMVGRATLAGILSALSPLLEPVWMPDGQDVVLTRAAVLDTHELGRWLDDPESDVDVLLLLGVRNESVVDLVGPLAGTGVKAILVKTDASPQALAQHRGDLGVAIIAVHQEARWAHVHSMVERVLQAAVPAPNDANLDAFGRQNDLFGLAITLSQLVNGLVSIDDEAGRVLAFSPLDESADEIRVLSILGRRPPDNHMEELRRQGFLDRAIHSGRVTVLEPKENFRRRLCVAMRDTADRFLGLIWVQERDTPFAEDAAEILESASHVAARLISNSRLIPEFQVEYVRQLIGLPISPTPYDAFGLQVTLRPGTAASVAGFATTLSAERSLPDSREAVDLIRFYATTFTEDALVAVVGNRVYAVNTNVRAPAGMRAWTERVAAIIARRFGAPVCVGISDPVEQLTEIPSARSDVDRILDLIGQDDVARVATLADLRTPVLLQDILLHLRSRPELLDPRLKTLLDHDESSAGELMSTLRAYLVSGGQINEAAESLHIHANTLRYRIRRIRDLTGLDLRDPPTRFLTELNVRAWV